jgi:hypothetical protein
MINFEDSYLLRINASFEKKGKNPVTTLICKFHSFIVTIYETKKNILNFNEHQRVEFFNLFECNVKYLISVDINLKEIDLINMNVTNPVTRNYLVKEKNDLINRKDGVGFFLNKIRNGFSHGLIQPSNNERLWKGIKIWNINESKVKDFEVILTNEEMKIIIRFLTRHLK